MILILCMYVFYVKLWLQPKNKLHLREPGFNRSVSWEAVPLVIYVLCLRIRLSLLFFSLNSFYICLWILFVSVLLISVVLKQSSKWVVLTIQIDWLSLASYLDLIPPLPLHFRKWCFFCFIYLKILKIFFYCILFMTCLLK